MSEPITIYFELEDKASAESIQQCLQQGLAPIQEIEASEVSKTDLRMSGVEIVAAIGVVIMVTQSAGQLIETSSELIKKLTELVHSIKGLKAAIVETAEGQKLLEDITAEEFMTLTNEER